MKNMKKLVALILAVIMVFSALTVAALAADEPQAAAVPSYSPDDLTYSPTMDTIPSKNVWEEIPGNIEENFGDEMEIVDVVIDFDVNAGYNITWVWKEFMRFINEIFDKIAEFIFPSDK